jgi:RTX calcium-binding nonapeptide repeat (4 copies)
MRILVSACAIALVAASTATGATVALVGATSSWTLTDTQASVSVTASISVDNMGPGAANDVVVFTHPDITAASGCTLTQATPDVARCTLGAIESASANFSGGVTTVTTTITANRTEGEITVFASGTGMDSGYTFDASGTIQGNVVLSVSGAGIGSPGGILTGGAGDDTLSGAGDRDTLIGGPGDDAISPGNTAQGLVAEIIDGGEGSRDSVGFVSFSPPVTVSLDGVANDSFATVPNARPLTISGIEDVSGTFGNDTITGNDGSNILYGLAGNDTVTGGGGIFDIVRGGLGVDTLNARGAVPGFTDVACGPGIDTAVVDFIDLVDANCETLDRAAAPPPPPPPPGPPGSPGGPGAGTGPGGSNDATAPTITLAGVPSSATLAQVLKGVRVRISTNERSRVVAELVGTATGARLKAVTNNLVLARRSLPLGTGTRTVVLKPPAKLLTGARTVTVRVVATDAAGNSRTTTRKIRIRR